MLARSSVQAAAATPLMSAHVSNARALAARNWTAETWSRRRWKRLSIWSWAERNRCAWPADLKRFICRSRRRVGWWEMLWGERRGSGTIAAGSKHGAPHAAAERPEPVRHPPGAAEHAHRGRRDEPVELARGRDRPGPRAAPAQEARAERGGAAA